MRLLLDNDILHKLLAFDLLEEALARLGATEHDIQILGTARFKFQLANPQKGRKRYGSVFDKLAEIIPRLQEIEPRHPDLQDRLTGYLNLDPGEVLLLSEAMADDECFFLTGDKRCIRALKENDDLADVCDALAGRVWCLEALIAHLIDHCGFETVRERVAPNVSSDTTMRAVFGSGHLATPTAVHEALTHYVDDLRKDAGELLAGIPIPGPDT